MKKQINKIHVEFYVEIKGEMRFVNIINCASIQEVIEPGFHYFALYDTGEFGGDLIATCDVTGDNEFYETIAPTTSETENFTITYRNYRWVNRIFY